MLSKKAFTIRMWHKKSREAVLWQRFAILAAIFTATNLLASAQSIPSSDQPDESRDPSSTRESLRWFVASTIEPPHLAGGILVSALGTAFDRPKEYGPHWAGFADRYGMGMAGSATGNAIEASAGLLLREDPRYFRVPDQPFKTRVGNVVRLAFAVQRDDGRLRPAYARYLAILGSNFLSSTWRVHSEANAESALLRSSEGFAGRMAANAFAEFWPDVRKRVFRKRK